ncbi:SdrD B-like domain-containing protein [Actinophytocola sp.]|uniref:SdrD B-like domain-containing protein n=1 Tax=Actinophytocola sp. TaxID=1872138 RepID=UPI002ECFC5EF
MTRVVTLLISAVLAFASAAPAAAAAAEGADLTVAVVLDKAAYLAYEDIVVTVTITNNGTAPAAAVAMNWTQNVMLGPTITPVLWEPFRAGQGEVTLQPGESAELPATFQLAEMVDVLRLSFAVSTTSPETDTANNTTDAEATITTRTTDLVGTLYGDRDGDRQVDPDEVMSGVLITGTGGVPPTDISTRTDAAGRFLVEDVPEGWYQLELGLPVGWQPDESKRVSALVGGGEAVVRAVRDSSGLRASITFDRSVYAVGDTIREQVTLTNTGTTDLAGVTARCVEGAAPNELSGLGWGDLVHDGAPGVTVRAGETRTFDFTDVVPPGGRLFGFITITCWFSTAFWYYDGPKAMTRAEVPGGRGSSGGNLFVDHNGDGFFDEGEGVPAVKLFLVADDGAVVGRAVTDAGGGFMFSDLPANSYHLRVAGPWRLVDPDGRVGVYDGAVMTAGQHRVIPGPHQPDLDAPKEPASAPPAQTSVPAPPPAPAPQASPRPANLADTGADVVGLTVLGALLLLAGAGLRLVSRPEENS